MLKKLVYLIFCKLFHRIKCINKEVLDTEEGLVICVNHTSWQDGVIMFALVDNCNIMCKAELFENKLVAKIFKSQGLFPIKRGEKDFASIYHAVNLVKSGRKLIIFPEGTRNARAKGVKAKVGAVYIANTTKSKIIPVYLPENYKLFSKLVVRFGDPIEYNIDKKIKREESKTIINEYTEDLIERIYALKEEKK